MVGSFGLSILQVLVAGLIFLGCAIAAFVIELLFAVSILGTNLAFFASIYAVVAVASWLGLCRILGKRRGV
ncbi:MAG: hypothetical protein ACI9O0_001418 [Paracoccaceae bacterium]|jgi:hypothetical protein